MHPSLAPLPSALLQSLGRYRHQADFAQGFPSQPSVMAALERPRGTEPHHVALPEQGLQLMLHCADANVPEGERAWGLHGFILETSRWTGDWPTGLDHRQATAHDVVKLLAADPAEALCTPALACFAVPGLGGMTWSVLAMFDAHSGKLEQFGLMRTDPWVAA